MACRWGTTGPAGELHTARGRSHDCDRAAGTAMHVALTPSLPAWVRPSGLPLGAPGRACRAIGGHRAIGRNCYWASETRAGLPGPAAATLARRLLLRRKLRSSCAHNVAGEGQTGQDKSGRNRDGGRVQRYRQASKGASAHSISRSGEEAEKAASDLRRSRMSREEGRAKGSSRVQSSTRSAGCAGGGGWVAVVRLSDRSGAGRQLVRAARKSVTQQKKATVLRGAHPTGRGTRACRRGPAGRAGARGAGGRHRGRTPTGPAGRADGAGGKRGGKMWERRRRSV